MSDYAIRVKNLSKVYKIGSYTSTSIGESVQNLFSSLTGKPQESFSLFDALKDVSFEIKKGESVGIIGKNGAGKSTLLKTLSRITKPTSGSISIDGRMASLLEVGTGFHPDLTGKENIFLNGAILGMRKAEIKSKFDEIVSFSGVEKFINTPVKRYSSGMYVRLAFAVAAHLEPEILIIDEVLAVGDAEFQKKCLGKMDEVVRSGRTILFVSHNLGAVSELCSRAILLDKGKIIADGESNKTIGTYLENVIQNQGVFELDEEPDLPCFVTRVAVGNEQEQKPEFQFGELVQIKIDYTVTEKCDFNIEFNLFRNYNCIFTTFNTDMSEENFYREKGKYQAEIRIPGNLLKAGHYRFNIILRRTTDGAHIQALKEIISFSISESYINLTKKGFKEERGGDIVFPGHWKIQKTNY